MSECDVKVIISERQETKNMADVTNQLLEE